MLSVNGCRLLSAAPAATRMGRWGRGGPEKCLLLGQVAISDFRSPRLRLERVCKQQLEPGCTRGISPPPPWAQEAALSPDPRCKLPATLPITPDPPAGNAPCPGTRRPMH